MIHIIRYASYKGDCFIIGCRWDEKLENEIIEFLEDLGEPYRINANSCVSRRNSFLYFTPIGNGATLDSRENFIQQDRDKHIRLNMIPIIRNRYANSAGK